MGPNHIWHVQFVRLLQNDYGTENSSLACIQIAFRYYHDDDLAGGKSFIYGPSKSTSVSYEFSVYTISNNPDIYVQV